MIYHIATLAEWKACELGASFAPKAFEREGFIHACQQHQIQGVLQRYFRDQKDLLLLELDEDLLGELVKYEEGHDKELFPHLYGTIPKNAIIKISTID